MTTEESDHTADTVDTHYGRPTVTEDLSNAVIAAFNATLMTLQQMHSKAIVLEHREPTAVEE